MSKFDTLMNRFEQWWATGRGTCNPAFHELVRYTSLILPDGEDQYRFYFGLSDHTALRLRVYSQDYLGRWCAAEAQLLPSGVVVFPNEFTGKVNRRIVKTLETLYD